ncbi:hypothetical protein DB347_19040 [Opitutaceae bacterium EW11]|nr:hypothetical protein DB347_19040 [Opitutaceae bacterium EW11]
MRRNHLPAPVLRIAAALTLAPVIPATAQTAPTADTPAAVPVEETIELSPFIVNATEGQDSYAVKETLAGSRVRTDVKDLGSAITVVTGKLLRDISANNAESLLQYTTNTEVGGLYGNFASLGNGGQLTETARLLRPANATRVRGLTAADNTRNFFLTDIPWDGYNVGRVDMQRGPNSMLFGVGSPAGIINTSLNDASFKNSGKVESRYGSYGSFRNLVDFNYVPLDQELAIRIEALLDKEKYQQKPAFNQDKRLYGSLRYDPKFLDVGGAHTSIRVNFENGRINANRPRLLPPIDAITPWFTNLNKATYDPLDAFRPGGIAQTSSRSFNPWFNEAFMGRIFNADVGYVFNHDSSVPSRVQEPMIASTFGIASNGSIDSGIGGLPFARPLAIAGYNSYSRAAGLPGSQYNVYKDRSLSDPSIYDFYNNLMDGPNKREWQNWKALNLDLQQTFFDNRLGFDVAYYDEHYKDGQETLLNSQQYNISVDINQYLADGSPNPNVGRPYVGSSGLYGNNGNINDRESVRATVYGELRAEDFLEKSLLTRILGHHVFTGLYSQDEVKQNAFAWNRFAVSQDWVTARGGSAGISDGDRQVDVITYIGPSLSGASSAANAHLNPLKVNQIPSGTANVRFFDSHWAHSLNPTDPGYVDPTAYYRLPLVTQAAGYDPNGSALDSTQAENPANYVGWVTRPFRILNADNGDIDELYTNGAKRVNKIDAKGFTWQGYFWDNTIVPTVGIRRDTVSLASAAAPLIPVTKVASLDYDAGPVLSKQSQTSKSWSVVMHTPQFLRSNMPWGTQVSLFYNDGENFKADTIRKDVEGRTLPNSTGRTKDYGFIVSALDDRVSLKVNWYKTTVKDATLEGPGAGIGNNLYYMYLLEAWGTATAAVAEAGLRNQTIQGQSLQGYAYLWDYATNDNGTPYGAQPRSTDSAAAATDAHELAAVDAWIQQMPDQAFFDAYGMPVNVAAAKQHDWTNALPGWNVGNIGSLQSSTGGTIGGIAPVATVDTVSKGIEFEFYAQPTKGWDITVNVAKTEATRQNLSSTLSRFIELQRTKFQGLAGDLRLWGNGGQTFNQVWTANIYGPYQNLLAQSGSSAPEIRPWRANVISNYTFRNGLLKGFNVGVADRWQQGEILGYALNATTQLIDVNRPYRGDSENSVDVWVGYQKKLSDKLSWRIQLNVRNVGENAHLIPISVQPDGSAGAYRIAEGQAFQLTNTFMF